MHKRLLVGGHLLETWPTTKISWPSRNDTSLCAAKKMKFRWQPCGRLFDKSLLWFDLSSNNKGRYTAKLNFDNKQNMKTKLFKYRRLLIVWLLIHGDLSTKDTISIWALGTREPFYHSPSGTRKQKPEANWTWLNFLTTMQRHLARPFTNEYMQAHIPGKCLCNVSTMFLFTSESLQIGMHQTSSVSANKGFEN